MGKIINLRAHFASWWGTVNSSWDLLGECASSSDHVVISGVYLHFNNEVKIVSCP